ncbi:MAG: TIGR01620 family protein [Pseudomonadota bacterium]
MTDPRSGPVLIEIDDTNPSPAEAAPVIDTEAATPSGQAMQTMATLAARQPSPLARWFWRLFSALAVFGLSIWAYDFVTGLVLRNPVLGYIALGLLGLFLAVCLAIVIREWAALARLSRLDKIHEAAEAARSTNDVAAARDVTKKIATLYAGRDELRWGMDRVRARMPDAVDADALFQVIEADLIAPLDAAATREVEAAARQVATVTALVPIALADVAAALTANLRMIRRISEIYGGRSGALGGWRLTRAVFSHLVATGAVAVGDDLIGSVAGGGILSKVSRRFGEGLINGALTARVGVAAMEVSRPLPFGKDRRPSVTGIVKRALTGLFTNGQK